jgi:glucose/arabinose dehydrogenase
MTRTSDGVKFCCFKMDCQHVPEIWTYGHRNPQGMIIPPTTGVIWEHEYGPQGGNELNIIQPKKTTAAINYVRDGLR